MCKLLWKFRKVGKKKKKKFGLEELRNVELLNEGLFNLDLKGWKEFWWQYRGRRNVYQCV